MISFYFSISGQEEYKKLILNKGSIKILKEGWN